MEKIKVKFKKDSPYGEYGYYRVGDIGTVVGYTQGCAVILKEDGSFVKVELKWIKEDINSIPENPVNEDEKIKEELKAHIGLLCDGLFPQKKDWLAWIEKQGKQKPEWSDEDEAMYYGVVDTEQYMLDVVYGRKEFDIGNESIKEECQKELDWLKSLRPQSQWKPSESDIRILEQVIDGTVNPINYHATLYAILEQLKKLKEE